MPHRHTDTESERLDLRQTDSQTDRLDLKRIDAYIADIQGTDKLHLKRMNAYIADFQGTDFRGIDLLGVYIHGGNRLNATDFMVPSRADRKGINPRPGADDEKQGVFTFLTCQNTPLRTWLCR